MWDVAYGMLDVRCLSPDFCIMKLEHGAQSELRCRHHRVTNSFTFTSPALYRSPMAGRKFRKSYKKIQQESQKKNKEPKKSTTSMARKFCRFFSLSFLFVSLWLSGFCFSWQIASDIKFIYAKFARRLLSYCSAQNT